MKKKILIIDDEKDICFLISEILKDENYLTTNSNNSKNAIKKFHDINPDLIILDVWLDGSELDGLNLLKHFKSINSNIPIIMISGHSTIDMAVKAIKEGAYDFIEKPFDTNKLLIITKRAIESSNLIKENIELRKLNIKNYELIGNSEFITELRNKIDKISSSSSRILISGPLGSGKKTIAHIIHKKSKRSEKPLVIVNCSLLNPNNIEEIIFGSSLNNNIGLLEKANNGTILFEEISDLPINIQSQILSFLQNNFYKKIDSDEKLLSDVKIISTTSKNLEIESKNGSFRKDLYFRLNVINIDIPPLNKRPEDLRLLCDYFINNSQYYNKKSITIAEEAYAIFESYIWPGNIRQLKNLIDRILIMHGSNLDSILIDSSKLPKDMGEINTNNSQEKYDVLGLPIKEAREIFEKNYLLSQIKRFNGNVNKVATFVGMERTALYRKLKSLDISTEI